MFLSLTSNARIYSGHDIRDGKEITVNLNERPIVALFLNADCPCSQSHFDHLNSLQKKYRKFQFIGFHANKSIKLDKAMQAFEEFEIDFPILLDDQLKYANEYGAYKTPHIYVITHDQKIQYQGAATDSRHLKRAKKFYLADALESLDKGQSVKVTQTKTLGCVIER